MRVKSFICGVLLAACAGLSVAASSGWSFIDATVTVQSKGEGVGSGVKESLNLKNPLSDKVVFTYTDTLKIALTTTENNKAARPHQAFLTLADVDTELEFSFPLSVKTSGKGKLDITHKDLPTEFLFTTSPLKAYLVIASFGTSDPLSTHVFDVSIKLDPNKPMNPPEPPLRYGKLPEIRHTFRPEPTSSPKIITFFFLAIVLAAVPALFIIWRNQGANLKHITTAFNSAPVSHTIFLGSLLALEAIFGLYYTKWNLFQMLPAAGLFGVIAYLSGSRALAEVHERRLAGLR